MNQSLSLLSTALQRERDAHAERYRVLTGVAPVKQRVAEGVAWFPLRIRETGYGFGEYPYVLVERTGPSGPHQLGGGKPCQLFSQSGSEQRVVNGTIHWVTGNQAHIILRDNDHPEWLDEGRIGVQLAFDASGFKSMTEALGRLTDADDNRLALLRDILFSDLSPTFKPSRKFPHAASDEASLNSSHEASPNSSHEASPNSSHEASLNSSHEASLSSSHEASLNSSYVASPRSSHEASPNSSYEASREASSNALLNNSQLAAVDLALRANDVAIIHGPPGTGKTTTLVEVIRQCAQRARPVLVCAPSNAAVDLLTERCAAVGLDVVRIGNLSRIDPLVMQHTLGERWKRHGLAEEIKYLRKRADEFRRLATKYKRAFGRSEMEQRKLLLQEARNIIADVRRMEQQVTDMIIDQADVVACTLVASRNEELRGRHFEYVVIDEAGQALDPAMCIPLQKAERLILAGDPHQLPPTIIDQQASQMALGSTMLERAIATHPSAVCLLTEQYRMNHVIMSYSNTTFYGGKVTSHVSVEDHTLPEGAPLAESLIVIDTSGRGWEESAGEGSESLANIGEAECAISLFDELTDDVGHTNWSIGVISPYRGQVRRISGMLSETQRSRVAQLDVDTVDSFQGSECDVIIISLVRSNEDQEIGFLKDIRRMNVAMTRARKKLIIIGDGSTIAAHPFYRGLWEYAEREATVISAWDGASGRYLT